MLIALIGLMTILQIVILCSLMKRVPTILAGGDDHFAFRYELVHRENLNYKDEYGNYLNKKDYDIYLVRGDSMSKCQIFDGQIVLSSKDGIDCISGHPAIVLKLNHSWFFQSDHAIRRFITYMDNVSDENINDVFTKNKTIIKSSLEKFVGDIYNSLSKMKDQTGRFVVTEIFDIKHGGYKYSLHHLKNIKGVVKYSF